jgi:hypothetical protein
MTSNHGESLPEGLHPDGVRWVMQTYGPLADPRLSGTEQHAIPLDGALEPYGDLVSIIDSIPLSQTTQQAESPDGRRKRLPVLLGAAAAVVTGAALAAGPVIQESGNPPEQSSGGTVSVPLSEAVSPQNIQNITVDFVTLQGSKEFSAVEQEAALANTATAVGVWQGISESFFPVAPQITNGGVHELDASVGKAADICQDVTRRDLQPKVMHELNRRNPLGAEAMRIVVMDASDSCPHDMAVAAEAYEKERVIFANLGGLGPRTEAHEMGHVIPKLADSVGYDCSDQDIVKPFPNPIDIETCEVRSHADHTTLMGNTGGEDCDPLSGPEMRRTGLIKSEQIAHPDTEQSGGADIVLDALPNPEYPGQTKLVSIPLKKIASFETILKTHKDSVYIELSGAYADTNQGLRVNTYLVDESSIGKETDNRDRTPEFYQVFLDHWGGSGNSEKAGQQIVIEGESGRLTINIVELTPGPNGQGQVRLNISTA